jgi:catechol 2,3-dioxygenase-like lactoylglutathione lyase family enzyme
MNILNKKESEVGKMSRPMIKFASVTLDCPNQEALADFYAALLGWEKQRFDEEWLAVLSPDGNICLLFQEIDDYVPPVWPNEPGEQQQMTHLDFAASPADKDAVINHAIACGATLSPVQYSDFYTVFFDPAGHPFCISFFG